jgi:DNA polymerase-4
MNKSVYALNWLYLDLNSYFATIEQQVNTNYRNKPIAVVPCDADTTCAIATSYEAKAKGVTTGTIIRQAKKLIPDLICVPAKHELYTEYHNKILQEIDKHIYVDYILSIDECACKLTGKYQDEDQAVKLANEIKIGIIKNVGDYIRYSIGIASNRFLAKVATNIQKPDGLVVIKKNNILKTLCSLSLKDLPGIGTATYNRLLYNGVYTIEDLCKLDAGSLRRSFGSILGERYWYMLRGIELPDIETKSKSIGNSQVLPPELRNTEDAKIIAHRLLQKAASRLRRLNYSCKGLVLNISTIDNKHYRETVKFNMLSDSISLADKMFEAWNCLTYQNKIKLIKKISVTLINIDFRQQEFKQKSLFDDATDDYINQRKSRERLSKTIDELNIKYGKDSVCIGVLPIESKSTILELKLHLEQFLYLRILMNKKN